MILKMLQYTNEILFFKVFMPWTAVTIMTNVCVVTPVQSQNHKIHLVFYFVTLSQFLYPFFHGQSAVESAALYFWEH